MENYQDVLAAFVFVAGFVTVVFIIAKYTYLVKKSMIEKGIIESKPRNKLLLIDWGCIIGGLGIGLLISSIFTVLEFSGDTTDLLVWGTILISGALGLVAAQFLRRKFDN
jgi:hypothetical protein